MRAQAALGRQAGFDGMMTSEHHGGFGGYLPNPLQLTGFLLDAMPDGWAAACPLLLPLRPAALVIEEAAWLAARFPGRVGLGVATGSLQADFDILETTKDDLVAALRERARPASPMRSPAATRATSRATPPWPPAGRRPVPGDERGDEPGRRAAGSRGGRRASCSIRCRPIERCRAADRRLPRGRRPRRRAHGAPGLGRAAAAQPARRSRSTSTAPTPPPQRRATGPTTRCCPAPIRPSSPRCSSRRSCSPGATG